LGASYVANSIVLDMTAGKANAIDGGLRVLQSGAEDDREQVFTIYGVEVADWGSAD
jgi:hypothetical protein